MFPLTAIVSLKNDSTALVDAKGSQAPFAVFSLLSFSFLYLNLSSYTLQNKERREEKEEKKIREVLMNPC